MSTATLPAVPQTAIDHATLEKVLVNGDLSKLDSRQRLQWYQARCEAAGLDPRTQPFEYLNLQGKLVLYAKKAATDQLIASRRLTVQILDRRFEPDCGLYEATCRVLFPDGHSCDDVGAVSVAGLRGDALANAVMKCVTKAKRRTVLSACGLGMLDESEVESIPRGEVAGGRWPVAGEEEATPGPAAARREEWAGWVARICVEANDDWRNEQLQERGEYDGKQIVNQFQLVNHVCSYVEEHAPEAIGSITNPDGKRNRDKAAAAVVKLFRKNPDRVKAIVREHLVELRHRRRAELGMFDPDAHPETAAETTAGEPAGREPGED